MGSWESLYLVGWFVGFVFDMLLGKVVMSYGPYYYLTFLYLMLLYTIILQNYHASSYIMTDYFNHGSDYAEIEPYYDENGNYYAYTTYDLPAGSPLRISYADPRNPAFLLARYGFIDENCPASYCKLLPPTVNQDMLDLGYSHNRMLFYRTGEVADEVREMIYIPMPLFSWVVIDSQSIHAKSGPICLFRII